MITLPQIQAMKGQRKISMITCYDSWSARIVNNGPIDMILVGDSAAMVMHGHDSTIPATIDMMVLHTSAVRRGAGDKFIVSDMPFLSYRKGLTHAVEAAGKLMQAGANAIKLEGVEGHEEIVKHLVQSGIPVMGHLGLTPQSVHQLGGNKVQGQNNGQARQIRSDALKLQELGCFSLVLECVPAELGKAISAELTIPTIGIGAGVDTDGQVLVMQDMLGMSSEFKPRFLRQFLDGEKILGEAFAQYDSEVKACTFPAEKESYR
ncbi:MAG: 3-methyl-2-oxobutanoate hydroxymethyltransferase [Clostridiales bacterium]|nr:3-methyl-2-oxobutanoate hydroxymethyltransferase [Clostridiales bacterium]MDN5283608.1 3-methyl-2-oxobutanoate hydroxymethyltransferase [Candidatus Ozemobacter sp.]